jgi:hypothetical protein
MRYLKRLPFLIQPNRPSTAFRLTSFESVYSLVQLGFGKHCDCEKSAKIVFKLEKFTKNANLVHVRHGFLSAVLALLDQIDDFFKAADVGLRNIFYVWNFVLQAIILKNDNNTKVQTLPSWIVKLVLVMSSKSRIFSL